VSFADPRAPVRVGTFVAPGVGPYRALAATPRYAYAFGAFGLRTVDTADPAGPVDLGASELTSGGAAGAIDGGRLYVVGEGGLAVVDLADPAHPRQVGAVGSPVLLAAAASGRYVYAGARPGGLHVIDVADPTRPAVIGSLPPPGQPAYGLDVAVDGRRVYVAEFTALDVIDVADPTRPARLASVPGDVVSVAVVGSYLVALGRTDGLVIYDASDPAAPRRVASRALGGDLGAYEWVRAVRDRIYVGGLAGVRVFDASDPRCMAEVGRYDTLSFGSAGSALSVAVGRLDLTTDDGLFALRPAGLAAPTARPTLTPRARLVLPQVGQTVAPAPCGTA
jgi:hypothetical protein